MHRNFKHNFDDGLGTHGKRDSDDSLPPRSRPRRSIGSAHHHRQRPLRARLLLFDSVGDDVKIKILPDADRIFHLLIAFFNIDTFLDHGIAVGIEGSRFDLAEEEFLCSAGAFGDVELAFFGVLEA